MKSKQIYFLFNFRLSNSHNNFGFVTWNVTGLSEQAIRVIVYLSLNGVHEISNTPILHILNDGAFQQCFRGKA